jgi:hypothetical protein
MLKIPCSEFFIYDFTLKKYNSIGKGDFTIEYARTDDKKDTPLLIFRNCVLKILFQGMYNYGVTQLQTVNKNFKTISVIQKSLVVNEQSKKLEFKSVKIQHVNDNESKMLIEAFNKLEQDLKQKKQTEAVRETESKNQEKEPLKEVIDINKVNKSQPNSSGSASQTVKDQNNHKASDEHESKGRIQKDNSQRVININKMEYSKDNMDRPQNGIDSKNKEVVKNHQVELIEIKNRSGNDKSVDKISNNERTSIGENNGNKTKENKIVVDHNLENNVIFNEINDSKTADKSKDKLVIFNKQKNEKEENKNLDEIRKEETFSSELKQSNPTSVGKITNINIQLIVSSRSKNKPEN